MMKFNLNSFLRSVSFALDFVEMDVLGTAAQHSERTAIIALYIGKELGMNVEEQNDLVALSILHDNGISGRWVYEQIEEPDINELEGIKGHCVVGERNIQEYPLLGDFEHVILYHHEHYDGSGFFGIKGDAIPLMSQIIHVADRVELMLGDGEINEETKDDIWDLLQQKSGTEFAPEIVEVFSRLMKCEEFWSDLAEEDINDVLSERLESCAIELSIEQVAAVTTVFSAIIDSKSKYTQSHSKGVGEKALLMSRFYGKRYDEELLLVIAADLHDIGKLAIPNAILDSPNRLTEEEFKIIAEHPYLTRIALQEICGFEQVTEWAANHHEKLDGSGYPFGLEEKRLDFNARLIACIDIYQALTEDRPYREGLTHDNTMKIMTEMADEGLIDVKIVEDMKTVLGSM